MLLKRVLSLVSPILVISLFLTNACSGDDDDSTGTGGGAGVGGKGGTGGTGGTGGSGGTSGSGGTAGSPNDAGDAADAYCGPTGPLTAPTVPAELTPPSGATLVARYYAKGDQIYTCTASVVDAGPDAGTTYSWVLKAPSATLYDTSCNAAGTHFAGPTWKSSDGSSAVGVRVASHASPNAGAIPLLLLKVSTNGGEGIFADVTAVQRLDTVGGSAPADGCSAETVNTDKPVPYTAVYYFYAGGSWPVDGGADASDAQADAPDGS